MSTSTSSSTLRSATSSLRLEELSTSAQKGFSVILVIAGVIVLAVVLLFAFKAQQIYQQKTGGNSHPIQDLAGRAKCSEHPKFAVSPLNPQDLGFITHLGRMSDSHVTPTDHQYWAPKSAKYRSDYTNMTLVYNIYSPADGVISSVEEHTFVPSDRNSPKIDDWRIIINHDCGVSTIYIHLDKLSDEISSKIGKQRGSQNGTINYEANIPVKKGQIISRQAERSFDFSMHDENVTLPGFVNPKRYENEFWKIHTVDPFDYFEDSIKQQLLTKVLRKAPPRGGKIDYDIEGKLVGTWFREGYDPRNINGRFWDAQLTIAYNNFDPSKIFVSTGNFNGSSKQFAVAGNVPDPKEVTVGQMVKYEVVSFSYVDAEGQSWNENRYTPEVKLIPAIQVEGVMLFKLQDKSTLKVETFPGKKASEVLDFTSKVQIYNR